ncbi:MAG: Ca2+-dependent phosphoinositide-specific phospholipase C [Oscillospiraceae bacterium]|nr:Ca2+-dependent phosphoinositide-specific phospholipase C [Oscillospiraceae bacterium]
MKKFFRKKFFRIALKVVLSLLGVIVAAALCVGVSIFAYSARDRKDSARAQLEHIAVLAARYSQPDFSPADERAMTGFDLEAAAANGARLNELRFLATHNSYKAYNPSAEKLMKYLIAPLGFTWEREWRQWSYGFEPLSEQFDKGIRSIELDVMREKDGFRCAHIPIVDYASNCPDFGLALKEIALWSDAHPDHLPITVLVEPKITALLGGKIFHRFGIEDVLALEALTARVLGSRLYTPGEMLAEHEDFKQLRSAGDYPALSELLGKIIVIYHYNEGTTEAYAAHASAEGPPRLFLSTLQRYSDNENTSRDDACFAMIGSSGSDYMEQHTKDNILVRTFANSYPWHDEEWAKEAVSTGAFILTTDYPPRDEPGLDPHVFTFESGATVEYK